MREPKKLTPQAWVFLFQVGRLSEPTCFPAPPCVPSRVPVGDQQPVTAAIALGSNLGDRALHLHSALRALRSLPRTTLVAASDFLETAPVGDLDQGPYLNAAALVRTALPPRELLDALHTIEREHGRDRAKERRWGPRTLDLDLLVYAALVLDEPELTIPHPRMHERAFVLQPLTQIAPDLVVPGRGTVAALLAGL